MRVAEDMPGQQFLVVAQLRLGVQAAARVVEVDLPGAVQACILRFSQAVERLRLVIGGPGFQESFVLRAGFRHGEAPVPI